MKWISRLWATLGLLTYLTTFLCLTFSNARYVFNSGQVYFLDADCYTRMARVRLLEEPSTWVVRTHAFENYPDGIVSHATIPLDYCILFLKWLLEIAGSHQARDIAGALVSPVLGAVAALVLWFWTRFRFHDKPNARWMIRLAFIFSPPLLWAFSVGRPDHQSLICLCVVLLTVVYYEWVSCVVQAKSSPSVIESEVQERTARFWAITSGLITGFALWVSFYEPLIVIILLNLCLFRFLNFKRVKVMIFSAALVLLVYLAVEGLKLDFLFWKNRDLTGWFGSIGELKHTPWQSLTPWYGWLFWVSPLFLIHCWRFKALRHDFFLPTLIMFFCTFFLTLYQARWAPVFALFFALLIPAILGSMKGRVWNWILFVGLLYPVFKTVDRGFDLTPELQERFVEQRALRQLTEYIPTQSHTPILAPWWFSPAMAYWSDNPVIASSSHQSLPGIIDSARFYTSLSTDDSLSILRQRKVKVVIAYDPQRLLANSLQVLGNKDITEKNVSQTPGYPISTAFRLFHEPAPDHFALDKNLTLSVSSPSFRLYWVLPTNDTPQ